MRPFQMFSLAHLPKLALSLAAGCALAGPSQAAGPVVRYHSHWPAQTFKARLTAEDRHTALKALQIALEDLGDGATFVWRKPEKSLVGMVQPTRPFIDAKGQVCRHVVYRLSVGPYKRRVEGIACRNEAGQWKLDG